MLVQRQVCAGRERSVLLQTGECWYRQVCAGTETGVCWYRDRCVLIQTGVCCYRQMCADTDRCVLIQTQVCYPVCWYTDSYVFWVVVSFAGGPGCVEPAALHSAPQKLPHVIRPSTGYCGLEREGGVRRQVVAREQVVAR